MSFQLTRLMRGVTDVKELGDNAEKVFQLTRLMRGVTYANRHNRQCR